MTQAGFRGEQRGGFRDQKPERGQDANRGGERRGIDARAATSVGTKDKAVESKVTAKTP
jgi:hypothetical protein